MATAGVQDVYAPLRRFLADFRPRSGAEFAVAVVAFTDAENRRGRAFAASAETYARSVFVDWKDRIDRNAAVVIVFGVENRSIAFRAGRRWRRLGIEEEVARALVEASGYDAFSRRGDFPGGLIQLVRFLDEEFAARAETDPMAEPSHGREVIVRARQATRLLEEAQRALASEARPDVEISSAFEDADLTLKRAVLLGESDGRVALAQIEATQKTIEEVLHDIQTSSAAARRFDGRLRDLRASLDVFPEGEVGVLLGRVGLALNPADRAQIERRLKAAERARLARGPRRAWPTLLEAGLELREVQHAVWRVWAQVAAALFLLVIAVSSLGWLRARARLRLSLSAGGGEARDLGLGQEALEPVVRRDLPEIGKVAEGFWRLGMRELERLRDGLSLADSCFLRRLGGTLDDRFDDATLRCLRRVHEAETLSRRRMKHLASVLKEEEGIRSMDKKALVRWIAEVESALADLDSPLQLTAEGEMPASESLETTGMGLEALVKTLKALDETSRDLALRVAGARRGIANTLPTILEMDSLMARSEGFVAKALEIDGRIAALGQAVLRDPLGEDGRLGAAEVWVRQLEEEVATTVALLRTLAERQTPRLDELGVRVGETAGEAAGEKAAEAAAAFEVVSEPGFEPRMMLSQADVLLASARRAASGADAVAAKRAALDLDQLLTELEMLVEDTSLPADHVSRLVASETDALARVVELLHQRKPRLDDLLMANANDVLALLHERSQKSDSLAFLVRACLDAARQALTASPRRNLASLTLVARARRGRSALAQIAQRIEELPNRLAEARASFERDLQTVNDRLAAVESLEGVNAFRRPWQVERQAQLVAEVQGLESRRGVERPDWPHLRRQIGRVLAQADRLVEDVRRERTAFDEVVRVRVSVDRLQALLPHPEPAPDRVVGGGLPADAMIRALLEAVAPMLKAADEVEHDVAGSWLCAAANLAHAEVLLRAAERVVEDPVSGPGVLDRLVGEVSERMAKAVLTVSSVDFAEHQRSMQAALQLGDLERLVSLVATVFTEMAKLARNRTDPTASTATSLDLASTADSLVLMSEDPMMFLMGARSSEAFGTSLGRSSFVWREGERLRSPSMELAQELD
ncbi:MAG: hypothetical protein H6729_13410 [Deltaproteobacteria bacterium]|nr:hypothetical protein [Deltaproteobacteria bacterium]